MKNILCIGEALIDMICTDKGKTLSQGENFLKKPGGAPTNVAAALAALGSNVYLAAKVGDDPFGHFLSDVLKSFGVQDDFVFKSREYFTTLAFVSLMENGERDFYFNRGADGQLTWKEVSEIDLTNTEIVHFGSATAFLDGSLHEAYFSLLEKAKQQNVFICFDPNYRQLLFQHQKEYFINQSWKFLHSSHFFKVSDEEALMLTKTNSVAEAADYFLQNTKSVFAITVGSDGAILGLNGKTHLIKSIAIEPVDTTGAGDAFVGAVLHQLNAFSKQQMIQLDEDVWEKIIFNANKAGAKTCMYLGAMEAFKQLNKDIFE